MTVLSQPLRVAAVLVVLTLVVAACGQAEAPSEAAGGSQAPGSSSGANGEPIVVGDLAYFTGPFGPNGPTLAAEADFPIKEVINLDPPLGRPMEIIHEDIGTVGEGQAARKLIEQDDVDILLSPAHEYFTYRDYVLGVLQEEDRPLMPTVHGGVIPVDIGGAGDEPIFRAQGLDEGMGVTNMLYAEEAGVESLVLIATTTAGFQLMADAAEEAAEIIGIEVVDRIDAPEASASYRTEVERAAGAGADAIMVMAPPAQSGTFVKNIAEAGLSTTVILESGSVEQEFYETATADAIATQEAVVFPGFAYQENEAWEFFQPLWDETEPYGELVPATSFFTYTTYDLLIVTALAIEQAGSVNASEWAPAMYEVTDGGTVCHLYAECLELIRAGEDVDYDGVTGPATFTPSGVNAVTNAMFQWNAESGDHDQVFVVDSERHLEILDQVAARHEG